MDFWLHLNGWYVSSYLGVFVRRSPRGSFEISFPERFFMPQNSQTFPALSDRTKKTIKHPIKPKGGKCK